MNKISLLILILINPINLFSQDANFYFDRATTRANNDDIDGSIADWNVYLEMDPENVTAFHNRGVLKFRKGNYMGAIIDFDKVSKLPYKRTYIDVGDIKEKDDERYWKLQISAYFNKGRSKYYLEDFRGAIKDYSVAIEMDPEGDYLYSERGLAKVFLENLSGALDDFNKAIDLNPNIPLYYVNRGAAKLELGQKDSGCLDFSKAGEMGLVSAYEHIREWCN